MGVRDLIGRLIGIPKSLEATVVFDQSAYVKEAIKTLLHEGLIGLVLTSLMILIFLASLRATVAVFLSIPLSALDDVRGFVSARQHGQHHDPGRTGAGVFPHHRQFRDLAGKYLSASGEGASPEAAAEAGGARSAWRFSPRR